MPLRTGFWMFAKSYRLAVAIALCSAASVWAAAPATDAAPVPKVSFYREVKPIFVVQCQGCHSQGKHEGSYDITSRTAMFKAGESHDAAIVPGSPEKSNLLAMITPDKKGPQGKASMPKDKPTLSEKEVELVRRWISEGAADDTPATALAVIDAAHPPTYEAPPVITSLDFSPDDSLLAISGYHEALLYKADGSALVARLVGQAERLQTVAFSPDGKRLAVCGGSPCRFGEVQVWDVAQQQQLLSQMVSYDTLYGASWSADGGKIAFGAADNGVRAIDSTTGNQLLFQGAHSDWVLGTVFSSNSQNLISVSRDRSMKLIEVATQRFVDNITSITPGALKGGLAAIDRHPTKDEVVTGGADGVPKIFRVFREADKQRKIGDDFNLIRSFDALPGRIYSIQYSPDGNQFVVGSSHDGTGQVRVYNANDGKLVSEFDQGGPIFATTFSSDGKTIAAAGYTGEVYLLDSQTGKPLKSFRPSPWEKPATTGVK